MSMCRLPASVLSGTTRAGFVFAARETQAEAEAKVHEQVEDERRGIVDRTDRLRTAIGRACRDAGIPYLSPHDLRHRRISLLHHQGVSWAEIGARVGQRNLSVTADTYTHALLEYREIDRATLLERACLEATA